ncbi:MAG: hypothetical protein FGM57_00170 [Candidatus Taylorbacteria bacterium]|nr:hypothetical protein [Candidatus Taylorbacteria bacterium]
MKYLYHGSTTQNIKTLEPRKRYTPQGKIDYSAIYAKPLPAYAAAHSFPWSTDEGVGLDVEEHGVDLSIPNSLKERLQVPVSIYKLAPDSFEHTEEELTGYTWHTTKPIEILEEVKYPSVEVALKELGAKLTYF